MRASERTGLWLLGAALLAGMEFGYAHLQQVEIWPLQVMLSSLWRLAGAYSGAADSGVSFWAPPAVLIAAGLLAEVLRIRMGRRPAWMESSEGDPHE